VKREYFIVLACAIICLSLFSLTLSACSAENPAAAQRVGESLPAVVAQLEDEQQPAVVAQAMDTPIPTPGLVALATRPTMTPPPTTTPVPTTAPTLTPVPTLTVTIAPSLTPRPSPTTEPSRFCPETPPLKPEYNRFYLSAKKWPAADDTVAETHFWMSKPLPPGFGRILTNQFFPYGWDENGRLLLHNGVDTAEDLGTPVLAVADGTVVVAQSDYSAWYGWRCDWYGHLVVIELNERWQDQPVYALYGHVLNLQVEAGERVYRGQQVAEIGVGGAATHPHLHFEVRVGANEFDSTRNPILWLDPGPERGIIAGRLVDPEGRPWQGVPLALVNENNQSEIYPSWSYLGDPQNLANADEGWAENFVFSDLKAGNYQVITQIQDIDYNIPVQVIPGEVTVVEIKTEDFKTPVPEPFQEVTLTPAEEGITPTSAAQEITPVPTEAP
jgi:murein DD-endopeptidase MepM/ murein hydrolase activator NlpD